MRVFEAVDSDPMLFQTIDAQSPVSRLLQLKVGAQVGVPQHPLWQTFALDLYCQMLQETFRYFRSCSLKTWMSRGV